MGDLCEDMVIAVLTITTYVVPLVDLVKEAVVVMVTDVTVMTSASGMEIVVKISMMSVDLVMVIVVVWVVTHAGVMTSVKDMVIAVLTITTYVVPWVDLVKEA